MSQNQMAGSAPMLPRAGSVPTRAGQGEVLAARWRKMLLTLHIVVSVALIGADLSVITLGITGLISGAPELIRAGYIVMMLLVERVLLPLAISAVLTGILLGLGTRWGLLRYYWVLGKMALTLGALTALVFVLRPSVNRAAAAALQTPLADLAAAGIGRIGVAVTIGPTLALLVMLAAVVLAVYKPWGQTPFRRR